MPPPDQPDRNGDALSDTRYDDESAVLRAENAALKAELAALRTARDTTEANAAREKAIRNAVARETKLRERERAVLVAQLDALIRSSSEVRYQINADWSELAELAGGGFIPDTSAGNTNWLEEYIPEDHRALVRAEIRRAIGAKDTYNIEHKVNRVDGTVGWALSRAVPLFDEYGDITSWMGAASDITDRKRSEELQQILNDELTHRMKNTFSMVQAIATQTLRQSSTLEEGRAAISARLSALARAQDILTGANFAVADIRVVVDAALTPHQDAEDRITVDGPPLELGSQQALGLSLAIHELATNAAKYGALSNSNGTVSISWHLDDGTLAFDWIEAAGPPVIEPATRGFGSRLIEDIVASYFDGAAHLAFRPSGLWFRLAGTPRSG
ncbi:sensor histidine kinase [Roseivivax marinus]|uniref:sensor histidine kinase n=1 Tax=Roseivivax marinus TaxID=1379903 RepID=UPI0027402A8E|nr:HWE histidine kinase domain-containing protein [Roseivivax marinus]